MKLKGPVTTRMLVSFIEKDTPMSREAVLFLSIVLTIRKLLVHRAEVDVLMHRASEASDPSVKVRTEAYVSDAKNACVYATDEMLEPVMRALNMTSVSRFSKMRITLEDIFHDRRVLAIVNAFWKRK